MEYCVRPKHVRQPERPTERSRNDFDYYRWCVDFPAGDYLVWFQFEVGNDYFDGDSHFTFARIQREAEAKQVFAWMGQLKSNRLHVVRN